MSNGSDGAFVGQSAENPPQGDRGGAVPTHTPVVHHGRRPVHHVPALLSIIRFPRWSRIVRASVEGVRSRACRIVLIRTQ